MTSGHREPSRLREGISARSRNEASRLIGFLLHVAAGRGLKRLIVAVARMRWRGDLAAGMTFHPGVPVRPPASRLFLRSLQPIACLGAKIVIDPMAALLAGRRIDHACDVTARRQYKPRLSSHDVLGAERALPGHDMVLARGQYVDRHLHLREIDPLAALRRRTGILDLVLKIGIARIPAVHRSRQADA